MTFHMAKSTSLKRSAPYPYPPPVKRTLQSSVVMPTIETKSRSETLNELKRSEKKEDVVRNRRLFSNLIVGTLKQFQKEESGVKNLTQTQTEKQREIERRLELTEKENRDRILKEKEELLARRREKEKEFLRQKREKAIMKYAEEKEKHFRRLQCFIQTQTKPPIFFLPAKHTFRSLELLKSSAKKVEGLIELRREEMDRELNRDRLASGVTATNGNDGGSDTSDVEDYDPPVGLKSSVVAVVKQQPTDKPTPVIKQQPSDDADVI